MTGLAGARTHPPTYPPPAALHTHTRTQTPAPRIDINGDGKLHRNEFDGDHHSVKLTDIKN
jgi:hypothetical protein